jgi:2-(1,2-epoxy-1,2-dihydrophenyl)acetyl-CoA isomerase
MLRCKSGAGCRHPLAAYLKLVEQVPGRRGDRRDRLLEGLGVVTGRGPEATDLADVLERGGPDVGIGHVLGVRLAECLDAAAHNRDVTPAADCDASRLAASPARVTLLTLLPMTTDTEFALDRDLGVIRLYRRGGAAKIELNRPERMNAWNADLGDRLRDTVQDLAADPAVRAVLVTGAGRAFSSGADIREDRRETTPDGRPDVYKALTTRYHPIVTGIRRMPKPVVAAVQGAAAGIGLSLALSCDLIVAAESSYFLLAFVNIGLVPDGGSSLLVPTRIGFARAAELALLGERLPSDKALEWGLINQVVPDEDLASRAEELTWRLASGPTGSYAGTKRQLNAWLYAHMDDQLELEAQIQRERAGSADFAEGVTAFAQKRAPKFTGS